MTIVESGFMRYAPDSYVSVPKVFPRGTRFSVNNRGRWIGRDFGLAYAEAAELNPVIEAPEMLGKLVGAPVQPGITEVLVVEGGSAYSDVQN
jgi:hypothetical protein